MPDLSQEKSELRREIRARRLALSHADRTNASIRIAETLASLPGWPKVSRLAIYLAQNGEVDTQALAQLARRQGKQLYLPVLAGDGHMDFALWEPGEELVPNRYGIGEPARDVPRLGALELDLVCLPLVAWSPAGDRLGMGGGYYDRTLVGASTLKVGLAYELQQRATLPREAWDIRLDFVATEASLYECQGSPLS